MLVQFTVENFLSIRDKVYLSLEPSKDSEHPENLITKGATKQLIQLQFMEQMPLGKVVSLRQLQLH